MRPHFSRGDPNSAMGPQHSRNNNNSSNATPPPRSLPGSDYRYQYSKTLVHWGAQVQYCKPLILYCFCYVLYVCVYFLIIVSVVMCPGISCLHCSVVLCSKWPSTTTTFHQGGRPQAFPSPLTLPGFQEWSSWWQDRWDDGERHGPGDWDSDRWGHYTCSRQIHAATQDCHHSPRTTRLRQDHHG